MLYVIPISFVLLTLTLGLSFFLATLNLLYRDVARVTDYIFRAWYFLSPTIWALSSLEEGSTERKLVELNPLTTILEELHKAMLPEPAEGGMNVVGLLRVEVLAIAVLVLGLLVWMRTEPHFTKLR
jgi:ABC-type polysaccharide/polyol phosphate export permease